MYFDSHFVQVYLSNFYPLEIVRFTAEIVSHGSDSQFQVG